MKTRILTAMAVALSAFSLNAQQYAPTQYPTQQGAAQQHPAQQYATQQSPAQTPTGVAVTTARPETATEAAPKFRFLFFWRENDATTQSATAALREAVAKRLDRAESSSINIGDAANQALVNEYQVSRAPMPLVLCIAPNGAITGSMVRQVTDDAVDRLLVTPAMTNVTKALQDKQIAVVHIDLPLSA
jgi:hypothetical protein